MRATIARMAAGIALLLPAGAAHAECKMIQPFVCPCGTEQVPPNPRLTLFWPRGLSPRAPSLLVNDVKGHRLAFRLERLSRTSAYDAYAVAVTAASGTRFVVSAGSEYPGFKAAFRVDGSWRKPAAPRWEYRVETSSYEWPCSFERIRALSLPVGASAYRVEWRPDGAAGPVRSLVVPAQFAWFFSTSHPRGERDRLVLGHPNCAGWNFRWDDAAVIVRVRGLHPDGSEDGPSPPVRLEAPPRVPSPRGMQDTPLDLGSLESAWQSLLSALQSGRRDAVRQACTPAGWSDLQRALGREPDRLIEAGEGWSETPLRWLPNEERRGEGHWGPEIKAHSFRFARIGDAWLLDGYSPGD